jgi:hypothetical protein
MANVAWFVVSVLIVIGLFKLARAIEPHWCAKDASSFTVRLHSIDTSGRATSRWTDGRAFVEGDRLAIEKKVAIHYEGVGDGLSVLAEDPKPPRGKAIFLLDGDPMYAIRVPAKSPAVARLRQLVKLS